MPGWPAALAKQVVSYAANEPLTYSFPGLAAMEKPSETLLIADSATTLTGWADYGGWVAAEKANAPASDPRRKHLIARVAFPDSACVFAKGTNGDYWSAVFDYNSKYDSCARHMNGSNIGFADGHTKFYPSSRVTVELFGVK